MELNWLNPASQVIIVEGHFTKKPGDLCSYFQRTLNASRQPLDLRHHHDNADKQQRDEKKNSLNCNTYYPANSPTISKTNDKSSKIHKQKLELFSSTFECKMWIPEIFAYLHWSSTTVLQ
jgi:hypothetical protein